MFNSKDISIIDGPNISLRLMAPEDAEYVYGLRTNADYNSHLSKVQGTVENQRDWIKAYKNREAERSELYYIIERQDRTTCGTLRIYNINAPVFEWGSWILDHNKPRKAALESAVLAYHVAFDGLNLNKACFDVRRDNIKTLDFHRRFGAVETHSDEMDVFFQYSKAQFDSAKNAFWSILESTAS